MNYHYVVLWYRGCKVVVDNTIFNSSSNAENYAEHKLRGKVRQGYAYKIIALS